MTLNPELFLRGMVIIYFLCISMVHMATWLPFAYTFNQMVIFLFGAWAIANEHSVIHVELLLITQAISILLDCVAIGMYFQISKASFLISDNVSYFTLSAFFAFLLLILKPLFLFVTFKLRQYRIGDSLPQTYKHDSTPSSVPGYISMPDNNQPA